MGEPRGPNPPTEGLDGDVGGERRFSANLRFALSSGSNQDASELNAQQAIRLFWQALAKKVGLGCAAGDPTFLAGAGQKSRVGMRSRRARGDHLRFSGRSMSRLCIGQFDRGRTL
jgi:hypothetical protein